jgi:hypothetical protein
MVECALRGFMCASFVVVVGASASALVDRMLCVEVV